MIKEINCDKLKIKVYKTRSEMGSAAAKETADCIRLLLSQKDEINMVFAAAPSQNEMLDALCSEPDIDWSRVNAFHMDEYLGLKADAQQRFGNYLQLHIFGRLPFKSVNYIDSENEEESCKCYAELLSLHPIDIVCLGIGENGHIAFNDPWVADFNDPEIVKKVELDEVCRNQQVNDGCFECIDDVPRYALTLTVPTLFAADHLFCTVPAKSKANAVFATVNLQINKDLPATVMRLHKHAVMFCDADSAAKIL